MNTEDNQNPEDQTPEDAPEVQAEGTEENVVPLEEDQEEKILTPEDQIAALQQELLDARDRTMRALADAENTRKRAIKDRDDASKYAIANFARRLLDFSDNFHRSLQAIPDDLKSVDPRIASVVEGIEAMDRELSDVFVKNGVEKIEPLDEKFDANFHEVLFETAMPGKTAGTIIQVVEPGYILNDRLLRAAKVGLAKAEENTDPGAQVDQQV